MEQLNQEFFLLLNASSDAPHLAVLAAKLLAEWPIGIAMVIATIIVIRCWTRERVVILQVFLTVSIALMTTYTIRSLWYHARPFVSEVGNTLVYHAPTSSFPSFHATFLFSIGFSLLLTSSNRAAALGIMALGILTAWARVYLGVHFPLDMAGALIVALLAMAIVGRLPVDKMTPRSKDRAA